jgi:hypothetical protein
MSDATQIAPFFEIWQKIADLARQGFVAGSVKMDGITFVALFSSVRSARLQAAECSIPSASSLYSGASWHDQPGLGNGDKNHLDAALVGRLVHAPQILLELLLHRASAAGHCRRA